MALNLDPLSWGPLPSLKELPDDRPKWGHGGADESAAAPWVQAWRQVYVDMADPEHEEAPEWATVVNRHPHAPGGAGVHPQLGISPILFGGGTFGTGQYMAENQLASLEPVKGMSTSRLEAPSLDPCPHGRMLRIC